MAKRRQLDLAKVEVQILSRLELTGTQKRQTDQLMANLKSQSAEVEGKGLVPHDKRADAVKLRKISKDYAVGIKKTLTPSQFKKYQRMHANLAYALTHRRPAGVHF